MKRYVLSICAALLIGGCSDKSAAPAPQPATATQEAPMQRDPNTTRAKLNALGIPTDYAARFDTEKLVSIEEQRRPTDGEVLDGEYFFEGARLIRYRGAKVSRPAALDLQFDMQGALQSGAGPDVTEEDIIAIRDRAQLLRSHAVAQRSARAH